MGYQVVFSTYQRAAGTITGFSAGADTLSVCSTFQVLDAVVMGDVDGHTFLWEQISGTPVTFLTPLTQYHIEFNITNSDDKLFRFWIDKGTPFQQFDDVIVYGTPISFAFPSTDNTPTTFEGGACRQYATSDINITELLQTQYTSTQQAACNDTNNYALNWNEPRCDADKVVGYTVQEKDTSGIWNNVATFTPNSNRLYLIGAGGSSYRVVVIFNNRFSQLDTFAYSPSKYAHPLDSGPFVWSPIVIAPSVIPQNTLYNIIQRSVISIQKLSEKATNATVSANNSNYAVITRTLIEKNDPLIPSVASPTMQMATNTTSFVVLDLTGGDIGG